MEEIVEFVEVEQEAVDFKQQEPPQTEIVINLPEIAAPKKETPPKTTSTKTTTKPATKTSMKENGKIGESFSKFDLLKGEKTEETVTVRSKFDLLK